MADVNTDPYFAEAYHFALANYTNAGLKVGAQTPNPVYLARLQSMTLNHLRAFRRNGPKTTLAHLLSAARYGVASADRDMAGNANDIPQSYPAAVGQTITNAAKDPLAVVGGGLHGIAAIGDLAVKVTELMSGKHHVLLRTVYVVFGGLFLLAGIAILARELGMKPPVDVSASISKKPGVNIGPVKVSPKLPKAVKVATPKPKPKPKSTLKAKGAVA